MDQSQNFCELPVDVLRKTKCVLCDSYLSRGPVRCNSEGKGICGRCEPTDKAFELYYAHRNLMYEQIVATIKFPCIYDQYGCKEKLLFNNVGQHEEKCLFALVECGASKECSWKSPRQEVFDHFRTHNAILEHSQFKIDIEKDVQVTIRATRIGDAMILLRYKYDSANKLLSVDAYHINANICECLCKMSLFNDADRELFCPVRPFRCDLYVSKHFDIKWAQEIDVEKYLYALENPKIVTVELSCTYKFIESTVVSLVCSSREELSKIICGLCSVYMVPPIVKHKDKYFCQCCRPDEGDLDSQMNSFAENLNYPCRWKNCMFVSKSVDIRRHEFHCNFANIKCCLGCNEGFKLQGLREHLKLCYSRYTEMSPLQTLTINLTPGFGHYFFCFFDDNLLVLDISVNVKQNCYLVEFKTKNGFIENQMHLLSYYLVHLHCKLTSNVSSCELRSYTSINTQEIQQPNCFKHFSTGYTININIKKKDKY